MFCPQCAAENQDDAKYCRACRQNLKAISQAMNQSLPLALASKLDEFLERTNERLRRDSILSFLWGAYFLSACIWRFISNPDSRDYTIIMSSFAFLSLGWGVWLMLAHRRSLSLSSNSAKVILAPNTIYCPRCAHSNETGVKFCPKCGESLKLASQLMMHRLPASITYRLDGYIQKKQQNIHRDILISAFGGMALLFLGILAGISSSFNFGWNGPIALIVFGCVMLICAGWDLLVEKRSPLSTPQMTGLHSPRSTNEIGLHRPEQVAVPPRVTNGTTRRLDERTEHSRR